jgi:hypothetical protein
MERRNSAFQSDVEIDVDVSTTRDGISRLCRTVL